MIRQILRMAFSTLPAMGLLALLGFTAPASSLDCSKAADPVSTAICASPTLLTSDAALANAYSAALRKLKGDQRALLLESQRQWLAERQEACKTDVEDCLGKSIAERQGVLAVCFAGSTATDPSAAPSCPYYIHRGCPALTATGPAGLKAYPFLVAILVDAVRGQRDDFGCGSDDGSDPSANEASEDYTLETERPGLACVRAMSEAYFSGAAHPMSSESLDCYDTRSAKKLPVATILPSLTPESPDFEKIVALVDGHLELSCCDDAPKSSAAFADIGGEASLPSGWAVTDAGDLTLAFTYPAYGRSFIATATVPQAAVIDMVAEPYRRFFVAKPK